MKIAFVGGGSVQWTVKLVTDMALNPALAGAELVLHDIDAAALALSARASRRVVEQLGARMTVAATAERTEALRGASFVILCVAIGGMDAVREDLAIPERYRIYQSVGDTVGPGGWARSLRHIPFAVGLACEMERLCPEAWLLNLTNPMTTICRSIARATGVRTVGLCHEVDLFRRHRFAPLFGAPPEAITLEVAGINHLPAILRADVEGEDGLEKLRRWLAVHDPLEFVGDHDPDPARDVFKDRLAVKLVLFQQLGVLFGAGDRHLAEFLPAFLTEATDWGARYGVLLTAVDQHRLVNLRQRRAWLERFVAGESATLEHSDETLAPAMAALAGGPPGRFVVNVPNAGQIDNLPRAAVVECLADLDVLGVRPVAVGALPHAVYAAVAPHVARQELIVEAALTGRREAARAALALDPLVRDPATVDPLFDDLLAANARFVEPALTVDARAAGVGS